MGKSRIISEIDTEKTNITKNSTYMTKKIERAKLLEQIRAEFPGDVPEGKGRFKYVFSEEQSQWLHDNVGKEYTLNTVAVALGISYYPLMRELAKRDETMRTRFLKEQELRVLKTSILSHWQPKLMRQCLITVRN